MSAISLRKDLIVSRRVAADHRSRKVGNRCCGHVLAIGNRRVVLTSFVGRCYPSAGAHGRAYIGTCHVGGVSSIDKTAGFLPDKLWRFLMGSYRTGDPRSY